MAATKTGSTHLNNNRFGDCGLNCIALDFVGDYGHMITNSSDLHVTSSVAGKR